MIATTYTIKGVTWTGNLVLCFEAPEELAADTAKLAMQGHQAAQVLAELNRRISGDLCHPCAQIAVFNHDDDECP